MCPFEQKLLSGVYVKLFSTFGWEKQKKKTTMDTNGNTKIYIIISTFSLNRYINYSRLWKTVSH